MICFKGTAYGESPENLMERALLFYDSSKNEVDELYSDFVFEKYGEECVSDGVWKDGGYIEFGNAAVILSPDAHSNIEVDYTSVKIFSIVSVNLDHIFSGDLEWSRAVEIRNSHFNKFVDYLLQQNVVMAERIPNCMTGDEMQEYVNSLDACDM